MTATFWRLPQNHRRLQQIYPTWSKERIMAAFPGRTWGAICATAHKLGIERKKRTPRACTWNDPARVAKFAQMYAAHPWDEILAEFPGHTQSGLTSFARKQGFKRPIIRNSRDQDPKDPLFRELKERRIAKHIRQCDLAAKIGYANRGVFSRVECGDHGTSIFMLRAWAQALGMELCLREVSEPLVGPYVRQYRAPKQPKRSVFEQQALLDMQRFREREEELERQKLPKRRAA